MEDLPLSSALYIYRITTLIDLPPLIYVMANTSPKPLTEDIRWEVMRRRGLVIFVRFVPGLGVHMIDSVPSIVLSSSLGTLDYSTPGAN